MRKAITISVALVGVLLATVPVQAATLVLQSTGVGLAAGDLDTTFSGDGKVMTNFTPGTDYATSIAIQADGKIVVAGGAAGSGGRWALARYNTDGTADTSFSGDGKVTTNFTSKDEAAWGVVIQSDQKIVAAGDYGLGTGNSGFAVARYNTDGTLDTSFSGDGKVVFQFTSKDDPVAGLAIQPDDKVVVAGGAGYNSANPKFALARLNTDGTLDTSFSGDGKVTTDITDGLDYANAVLVQPDDKIVAGGYSRLSNLNSAFSLVRYNSNGSLDSSFNGVGKVITNFTPQYDSITGLGIDSGDRIVAAGSSGAGGSNPKFAVARYATTGALDTTFSGDGKTTTDFTSGFDGAWDVAVQGDNRIVAVGLASGSGGRFALARYTITGSLDSTFSGDGKVLTNFTAGEDLALGVAIQTDGAIVAVGVANSTKDGEFAVARYLGA